MDFDYYQIKGKWNAATLNRRAEKLEEAQAAADELEEAGAKGVEIIGVKAGKREKIRGKKKAAKDAKTPKSKKAPAKKNNALKAAKKPKDKINNDTPKRETAGQLDLFIKPLNKKFDITFTNNDLIYISAALGLLKDENKKISSTLKFKELKECILKARNRDKNVNINLDSDELNIICNSLQIYYKISFNDDVNKLYKQLLNLSFPYSQI